jgi:hypothetical protein
MMFCAFRHPAFTLPASTNASQHNLRAFVASLGSDVADLPSSPPPDCRILSIIAGLMDKLGISLGQTPRVVDAPLPEGGELIILCTSHKLTLCSSLPA